MTNSTESGQADLDVWYLRATKEGEPIWSEDCVCENPVYPSDPDGSDADCISMAVVRLADAQALNAELVEALQELVACKDIKDRLDAERNDPVTHERANAAADYECRAPWAWKAARAALSKGKT